MSEPNGPQPTDWLDEMEESARKCSEHAAAMGGPTCHWFRDTLKKLNFIDWPEFRDAMGTLGMDARDALRIWPTFRDSPINWFLSAHERPAKAIWALIAPPEDDDA